MKKICQFSFGINKIMLCFSDSYFIFDGFEKKIANVEKMSPLKEFNIFNKSSEEYNPKRDQSLFIPHDPRNQFGFMESLLTCFKVRI